MCLCFWDWWGMVPRERIELSASPLPMVLFDLGVPKAAIWGGIV